MRILLTEGSSLSARQATTALGLAGHRLEICDPDRLCLGRFSRFVRRWHRCPRFGQDPGGYLRFVLDRLEAQRYDVLLPVHEQAFLFARARDRMPAGVGLAVAGFGAFQRLQSKVRCTETMDAAGIPHPPTRVARSGTELRRERRFPVFVKGDYGTASSSIWRVSGPRQLNDLAVDLSRQGLLAADRPLLVQAPAGGALKRVQAVFDSGRLVAIHAYRQIREGLGGGDVAKISVARSESFDHMERLGAHLGWHGALSADTFFDAGTGSPSFIDVNPRLVEPMNAYLAGVNLADLVVRLSAGERLAPQAPSCAGVRTHMVLMALLDAASRRSSRAAVLGELARALSARGIFEGSREELLPLRLDALGVVPLAAALSFFLGRPGSAVGMSSRAVDSYALTSEAARRISSPDFI